MRLLYGKQPQAPPEGWVEVTGAVKTSYSWLPQALPQPASAAAAAAVVAAAVVAVVVTADTTAVTHSGHNSHKLASLAQQSQKSKRCAFASTDHR